jgi:plastocyanin
VPTTALPTAEPTKVVVVVVENQTTTAPTPTPTATALPTYTITFTQDLTIVPGTSATIPVGGSVTWVNADPYKPHTVMATDATDGAWFGGETSATIPSGKSFVVTFPKAGMFEYTTVYQPNTAGVITVK